MRLKARIQEEISRARASQMAEKPRRGFTQARARVMERADVAADRAKAKADRALAKADRARARADRIRGRSNRVAATMRRKASRHEPVDRAKAAGTAAGGIFAGLAGAFFLDPESGKRRRHVARDKIASWARKGAAQMRRSAEYRGKQVVGAATEAKKATEPPKSPASDENLAERVRSELFRPADVPKGKININVENGIVYLRGEVDDPDQITDLVEQAKEIDGVSAVENRLHVPA